MNELLDHWTFIEPDNYLDFISSHDDLPKNWLQIFYIARCIFSNKNQHTIKKQLKPILDRKEIFTKENSLTEVRNSNILSRINLSNSVDIGRITSFDQISYILPREFVINSKEIFYKKLINRELSRKEFNELKGLSVSELVYGREKDLNRNQKIYILFDNSSSMSGDKFNKLFAAKAICIEYLKRAQEENPQIHFRYFNQDIGPLLRISKQKHIKRLIQYIMELNTYDCYKTKIGDALTKAINDIKGDPELKQAEIVMITDGLGEVPEDIKEKLGKIKFHIILISDINTDKFLKSFPNKETWEKAALQEIYSQLGLKDMTQFREAFSDLPQIYKLQEISDIFIKIDSFFGEKFSFTNIHELDLIRNLREDFHNRLKIKISNKEKYDIFQRIKFIKKYLEMIITREPPKELRIRIKEEIKKSNVILKEFKEDEWFVSNLENSNILKQKIRITNDKNLMNTLKRSNKSLLSILFVLILQSLRKLPLKTGEFICGNKKLICLCSSNIYRRIKIKKRFRYIDKKIFQSLDK